MGSKIYTLSYQVTLFKIPKQQVKVLSVTKQVKVLYVPVLFSPPSV